MTRTKMVLGKSVPLTAEENAVRDAQEAAWLAEKPDRIKAMITDEANTRTVTVMGGYSLARLISGGMKLLNIKINDPEDTWTAGQQAKWNALQAIFDSIDNIETSRVALHAQVDANTLPVDWKTNDAHWQG